MYCWQQGISNTFINQVLQRKTEPQHDEGRKACLPLCITDVMTHAHVTGAEDQVSVNQQVERSKMESDYQAQMATLSDELNRVRQELTSRTEVMGQEMERWRQAAEATARQDTHSPT